MPEYRRFIAYFYEYIDGKKQKNVGFAKVELRNGMWRLLLRITAGILPEPPIRVYGFVRESGFLSGCLLGVIRPVREIAEEWAFRADAPMGKGNYRFENFAGIWIESSDNRCFATVWDDEEFVPAQFVAEASKAGLEQSAEAQIEEKEIEQPEEAQPEERRIEQPEEAQPEAQGIGQPAEAQIEEKEIEQPEETRLAASEIKETERCRAEHAETAVEELFRKRTRFQPFDDAETEDCVMILPCDIVRLQQENWSVGRSSFLQHGFYQYRHLLLGRTCGGTYLLGVPGIRNPQETYMAQMFGYDRFKASAKRSCGQVFGYWCRKLEPIKD